MICPICSAVCKPTGKFCDGEQHPWYSCSTCTHSVLDISDELNRKFQSSYRRKAQKAGDIKSDGTLNVDMYYKNREHILSRRVKKIDKILKEVATRTMFDIGCGGGYMLKHYSSEWNVQGIEIDALCVKACAQLNIPCIHGDFLSTEIDGKFGVVTAWHVLEHSMEPVEFMRKMASLCIAGGIIVVEIPIKRGLKQRYDGHPQCFTEKSFNSLMSNFIEIEQMEILPGVQKPALLFFGKKI